MAKKLIKKYKSNESNIRVLKDCTGYIYHEIDDEIFKVDYPKYRDITDFVQNNEIEELVSNYEELVEPTRSEVIRACLGNIVFKKKCFDLVGSYWELVNDIKTKDAEISLLYERINALEDCGYKDNTEPTFGPF